MERITRHVSYANVAATLALVFAMSGVGYAASGGFTSGGKLQACVNEEGTLKLLKAGKHCQKGQKSVSWGQVGPAGTKGATGAAGASGATGASGANGGPGGQGAQGPQGTAIAYAHVRQNATLDASNSSGVVDVERDTETATGAYCLYGNFTPHVASALIDWDEAVGTDVVQEIGFSSDATFGCPSSPTGAPVRAWVVVRSYAPAAELMNAGFFITFN
jgi:hypothetical protein